MLFSEELHLPPQRLVFLSKVECELAELCLACLLLSNRSLVPVALLLGLDALLIALNQVQLGLIKLVCQ